MRSFAGRLWWRARHATVPLLLPGLLCLAAAIAGQALNVSGVNVPVLAGSARWFVGLLGAGLVGLALVVGVEPLPRPAGVRGALPEPPPNHVVRPELLGRLRAALLDGTGGGSRRVGVGGWGAAASRCWRPRWRGTPRCAVVFPMWRGCRWSRQRVMIRRRGGPYWHNGSRSWRPSWPRRVRSRARSPMWSRAGIGWPSCCVIARAWWWSTTCGPPMTCTRSSVLDRRGALLVTTGMPGWSARRARPRWRWRS